MCAGADARSVDQCPQSDVNERAIADHRIQQRAARLAANVVSVFLAEDQQVVPSFRDAQLIALDPGEGFERGTRRATAVRAMAVQGINELVLHCVVYGSAQALSGKHGTRFHFGGCVHDAYRAGSAAQHEHGLS